MQTQFEVQLEIEPIVPDTPTSINSYFDSVVVEAIAESALQRSLASEPRITFEQHLPLTKEQVETVTVLLAFVLKEAPNIWQSMKPFLDILLARLSKKAPTKVSFKLQMGDKKIEAVGLSPQDAVKIITDKYEIEMRPHR